MIGIAVIGAGRIGRIHARNLQQHPAADLRYIFDVSAKAARQLAAECATEVGDIESVLADPLIQALVIASPTTTHAGLIAAAAAAARRFFVRNRLIIALPGPSKVWPWLRNTRCCCALVSTVDTIHLLKD